MSKAIVPNTAGSLQSPPVPDTPHIAAIYARVSTEDQVKGYSIPTQIEACQALAQREGYTVPATHIFVDEGITGTTLDRPALRRLRDIVAAQAVAAVIILDPDRLSRKMGKLLVLTDELQAANIPLLCVTHPIEYGPEGVLFFQMRGMIAEYEREKVLERMKRGRLGRAKSGSPSGGSIPLGYRYIAEPHKGRLEVDEGEAAIVRRIFTMYAEGMTLRTIAAQLSQERIPTKVDRHKASGRKLYPEGRWHTSSIDWILHNETYICIMYWNKKRFISKTRWTHRDRAEWVPIAVPALISEDLFATVQQQRKQNQRDSKRNRKYEYLLLGGRLRCGRCGASMVGCLTRQKRAYRCYSQVRHYPGESYCHGLLRADVIESQVWGEIERLLDDPTLILAEIERQAREESATHQDNRKESQAIQKALASLEREAQRWDKAYAEEDIELAEWRAKRHDITERKQRWLAQQEAVETIMQAAADARATRQEILMYCLEVKKRISSLDIPSKRQALAALDLRVTWSPGEPIHIEGNIGVVTTSSTSKYVKRYS